MSTIDHVNDFSAFAADRLSGPKELSIEELFEEWRASRFRDTDAAAVLASVRDLESGERGQPLTEFLAELDAEQADA